MASPQCFQEGPGKPGPCDITSVLVETGVICNPEHRATGNESPSVTKAGFQAVIHPWDTG